MHRLFPCGLTRRELIWEMGGGFAGVALTGMLASEARATPPVAHAPGSPLVPKKQHFPAKAKSCIFLMMNGGPSQVDTFDPKPTLEKYAGKEMPKDKKFINSGGRKIGFLTPAFRKFCPGGKSGLPISDYFPRVREHADKLAVIRSCHTDSHAHGSALVMMNTGKTFIGRPSLGSWAVYGLGTVNQDLPGYVVLMDRRGGPISGQPNWSSGFMSAAYPTDTSSAHGRVGATSRTKVDVPSSPMSTATNADSPCTGGSTRAPTVRVDGAADNPSTARQPSLLWFVASVGTAKQS